MLAARAADGHGDIAAVVAGHHVQPGFQELLDVSAHLVHAGLLAQGDEQERALLKQLRRVDTGAPNPNWLQALALLAQLDNRDVFARLTMPGLHLLAERDALVPAAAAQAMTALNSQQHIELLLREVSALRLQQDDGGGSPGFRSLRDELPPHY